MSTAPEHAIASRLRARVEALRALRASSAFANYRLARERIFELMEADLAQSGDRSEPSLYWQGELEGLDYLLDASPLVVDSCAITPTT